MCVSDSLMIIGEASGRSGGICTGIGPSPSPRRGAGFVELCLDQPQPRPHDIRFLAAVGIKLAPVGTAEAVIVTGSFEKLGEGGGFVARQVYGNRDSGGIGHGGPP